MHHIHIHTTTYSVPSQWDELSAHQLRLIARLSMLRKKPTAYAKLFFLILTSALPLVKRLRLQWFYIVMATTDERGDLLTLLDSFIGTRKIITQKLPKLWVRTVPHFGPNTGLANCTFYEFIQAEQAFLTYRDPDPSKAREALNTLVAILYRPKRSDYRKDLHEDPRIPLTNSGIKSRLPQIANVPEDTKLAILMWFDSCREQIIHRFPLIFGKPKTNNRQPSPDNGQRTTDNRHPPTATRQRTSGNPWLDYISELSGGMMNYEDIGNTNLFIALTDISYRIRKNKEAEKARAMASRNRKKR